MTERIRVLLVDDHGLFRSGIKSLLKRSDEFEVVGEAADGPRALAYPAFSQNNPV